MHLPIQGKPSKIKETLKLADKLRRILDAPWNLKIFLGQNFLLEVVEKEKGGASGAQKVIDPKKKKRLLGILTAHEEITAKRGGETYLGKISSWSEGSPPGMVLKPCK